MLKYLEIIKANKKRNTMFKQIASFTKLSLLLFLLNGCTNYNEAMKVLPNELSIADDCRNNNKQFEMDCYDLISYKNTFAQLRLGINAQYRGNFQEAFHRFVLAKEKGNFYANALIADLYNNGYGVAQDENKMLDLLKDVKEVDPIAAYKLSFYYLSKDDFAEVIKLLTYAAENGVKDAQNQLSILYSNGQYIEPDFEKSSFWHIQYEEGTENFINKIYGI